MMYPSWEYFFSLEGVSEYTGTFTLSFVNFKLIIVKSKVFIRCLTTLLVFFDSFFLLSTRKSSVISVEKAIEQLTSERKFVFHTSYAPSELQSANVNLLFNFPSFDGNFFSWIRKQLLDELVFTAASLILSCTISLHVIFDSGVSHDNSHSLFKHGWTLLHVRHWLWQFQTCLFGKTWWRWW